MKFFNLLLILFAVVSCNQNKSENASETNDSTLTATNTTPYQKVEFESLDSLMISANLYEVNPGYPIMVLCHQRGYCKYEYAGVAERFNKLGYNCLAIDQRCGGPIADQPNETWLRAVEKNKPTDFISAEQDIVAAINYAYEKYHKPVILVGSSYSATLCIYQAIENEKVSSVVAFSPGNYFFYDGVKGDLIELLIKFEKPFFFTGGREEMMYVRELVIGRNRTENQTVFAPEGEGMHGARVLWPNQQDGEEYWAALELFIQKLVDQ